MTTKDEVIAAAALPKWMLYGAAGYLVLVGAFALVVPEVRYSFISFSLAPVMFYVGLLPIIIAFRREHKNRWAILIAHLVGGFVIGFFTAALIGFPDTSDLSTEALKLHVLRGTLNLVFGFALWLGLLYWACQPKPTIAAAAQG